jgi:hypothetical protein
LSSPDLQIPPPDLAPEALARIRARLHAELAAQPPRGYRFHLAWCLAATTGLSLVGAAAMALTGGWAAPGLAVHLPSLALLLALQGLGLFVALAPRTARLRIAGVLAALTSMAVVAALSRHVSDGVAPPWVCTLSHLAFDAVPLAVLVWHLRFAAPSAGRALVGGLAAGTGGAFLGELACGRGVAHVAAYHLPAWALVAVAAVALSRVVRPRSFAP